LPLDKTSRSAAVRIALVTEYYFPHLGGITEHVHNLALELQKGGHTPFVVTANMDPPARYPDRDHDASDPPFVRRVGTSRTIYSAGSFARVTTGRGLRRELRELFRRERIDLVHVHGGLNPTLGLVAPEAAGDLGLPAVATFHSWFAGSALCQVFRRPLQQRLNRLAAKIAVSEPVVQAHARYFEADWEIIPNGVDVEFFRFEGRPDSDGAGPSLLFLGRLDPRNGLDTVIAALALVLERRPETRLTVAGDGPLRAVYERLARPLGPAVTFVGRVNGDRPRYYGGADLYLCPTTQASFGITLLEAMACGTPMVVSDITGFRELVAGGREAVLVPKGSPRTWADTILQLLDDPAGLTAMSVAGRRKAEAYAWPKVTEQVMDVYRRVVR
jgi:phosphatidylinositol alpha-mannosyltransferase